MCYQVGQSGKTNSGLDAVSCRQSLSVQPFVEELPEIVFVPEPGLRLTTRFEYHITLFSFGSTGMGKNFNVN